MSQPLGPPRSASQRTYADLDALVLGMLQIICFRTYSNKELAEFASVATLRTATTNDIRT